MNDRTGRAAMEQAELHLAALSRSARPARSIYCLPPESGRPTQNPIRLAYTPTPRHAR